MEEALVQMLLADTALASLVGDRINWLVRPQADALPAVVLQQMAGAPLYGFAGRADLTGKLVQIDCWGATYGDAATAERAVLAVCDAPTDAKFKGLFVRGERDLSEPAAGGLPALFRKSLDVEAWFLET